MKLTRLEQRHASIIGRAVFPKGILNGLADDRDLGADIARQVSVLRWWASLAVRAGLLLVWYAPLFRLRFPRTFGGLSVDERCRVMDGLARSRVYWIREATLLTKMQFCFSVIGDPRVLKHIGAYDLAGGPVALQRRAAS